MKARITVLGAGLAGAEAAWQAASQGVEVELWEMRPLLMTPAHSTGLFAELVCSNSLRALSLENAAGLLKAEMQRFGSLIMLAADIHSVPAGGALAVDRESFASEITHCLEKHPLIHVRREEACVLPEDRPLVVATGPLTSERLAANIAELTGSNSLYFFDAAAPIVTIESINREVVFPASRYDKGEGVYLNCPLTEEQYGTFYQELVGAGLHPVHDFEAGHFFEGCMPVEELARRGPRTLLFGPLKPVGLLDPRKGKQPFAVVQLRQDNKEGTLYNLVGFQTRLTRSEQERVFRLIPGLEQAEFVRFGMMHRNTYLNSPLFLEATYQFRNQPGLFFAGQITGVEGYIESTASGLVAGRNAARLARGLATVSLPPETAHGALARYISSAPAPFQPMNINFGIFPPLEGLPRRSRRAERNLAISRRALDSLEAFLAQEYEC